MKQHSLTAPLVAVSLLAGCAQQPDQIEASYVSPTTFAGRNCQQLTAERNEIASRVNALNKEQSDAATTDAVATGVALVIFWPAAFALAATKDNSTALSAAKGNYDAITTRMRSQNCPLPPEPVTAPASVEKKRSWE